MDFGNMCHANENILCHKPYAMYDYQKMINIIGTIAKFDRIT